MMHKEDVGGGLEKDEGVSPRFPFASLRLFQKDPEQNARVQRSKSLP